MAVVDLALKAVADFKRLGQAVEELTGELQLLATYLDPLADQAKADFIAAGGDLHTIRVMEEHLRVGN